MMFRFKFVLFVGVSFLAGCNTSEVEDPTDAKNSGVVEGSGVKASATRDVPAFTGLESHGSVNVEVTVGKDQSVTVEVDDNLLQVITTEVRDNKLFIGSKKSYITRIGVHVTIQVPELTSVALVGSGDLTLQDVKDESLDVSIRGDGDATATGDVQSLAVDLTGSGDINLSELIAKKVSVSIKGAGNVHVHATETLDATLVGVGSVRYRGSPQVTKKVTGRGSVIPQ
jgi:hypothetical protein